MNNLNGNGFGGRYGEFILKYRWFVIVGLLALIALTGSGVRFIEFSTNYRVFFSEDNPQLLAFDELQNIYTNNDNIIFVIDVPDGDPFSAQSVKIISELTEKSWLLPYAIRVDGVTNFQHSEADGDDLIVADLVEDAEAIDSGGLARARRIALNEPLLKNRLISSDGKFAGINVTIQLPGKLLSEVPTTAAAALALADSIENKYPGTEIYLTGIVMINNAFVTSGQGDMMTVFPLMFLMIIFLMIILLRSFWGTITTVILIAFSAAVAVGLAGWFGMQLTPTSAQAPTMIMTLAVADSIHILVTMLQEMRSGRSRKDAIIESLRVNFAPVFLTSLTTVIGFLSLNFSDSPPYRDLGNITAMGVTAAFLLSISFLPAVLSLLPIKVSKRKEQKSNIFGNLADWVISRHRPILVGSVVVVMFAAVMVPQNKLNDEFVKFFDTTLQFRTDSDFASEHLTGFMVIEHSIGSGEEGGIAEPAYLAKLDSLAEFYKTLPNVVHVNHFGLVMKRLNMNMHGDDSAFYRIPDERNLAAQYTLLYEMSLPYGLDLNNMISIDKSSTRMTVTCKNIPSAELIALSEQGEKWLIDHAPKEMFAAASSPALMFSHLSKRQVLSMINGAGIALVLITLCMIIALCSFKYGLISVIPNMVPMVLGFGAWALLVGELGMAQSSIVGMTLGIVVDDTVHFLNKYLRARRERGLSPEDSVRYAFTTVGRALFITTVVLVAGFLVLTTSTFRLNAELGQLAALTIAFALIADFFLLPALLLVLDRSKTIKSSCPSSKDEEASSNLAAQN
ncbi:MAG: MMPL family transporter [candidate division Zixibacteria bacterium]|nr:MMPL family transporter [candidate division Zixibacteria bacterium]